MTPERLRAFIAGRETLDVEFKGEASHPLSDSEPVEAVVRLANRPGSDAGWLLVGVEDDGRVTGARPRHRDRTGPLRVQALIAGRTRPSISVRAAVVPVGEPEVLAIEVPAMRSPLGASDGKYLRRAIGGDGRPACLPMHFHEMQALQADRGLLDGTGLALPDARWEDLDPLEFERFRRLVRESQGRGDTSLVDLPDLELAKALGAAQATHAVSAVRVLGLLLFGREEALRRLLPTHEVAFQVLSGQKVEVNDFFRWPLLRVVDELLARFRARNREDELLVGMLRVGVPDSPPAAFREGVANALIHRDYTRLGTVHVQWHDDRIEIANPGGFPEGVRLDNLLVTQPRPRNPLLADAFKRAGIVERTARGIDTIFAVLIQKPEAEARSRLQRLVEAGLVEPRGERKGRTWHLSAAAYRRLGEKAAYVRQRGFEPLQQEQMVLQFAEMHGRITRAEAAGRCRLSPDQACRLLQRLTESNRLTRHGAKKGAWYERRA